MPESASPTPAAAPQPEFLRRDVGTAYKWFVWLGLVGAHQFYLGRPGAAVLRIVTLHLLGVLWVIDSLTLDAQTAQVNARRRTAAERAARPLPAPAAAPAAAK